MAREKSAGKSKVCSRCHKPHKGMYETCDGCRGYNNANKMIYAFAQANGISYADARDGMRKALMAESDEPEVFKDGGPQLSFPGLPR